MNSVLQKFCSRLSMLGLGVFRGALDAKKDKKPVSFISLENGTHIPLFEGQTKKEATEKFIKKKESEKGPSNNSGEGILKLKKAADLWNNAVAKKDLSSYEKVFENLVNSIDDAIDKGIVPKNTSVDDVLKSDFFDGYQEQLSQSENVASEPESKYTSSSQAEQGTAKSSSATGSQLSFAYQGAIDDSDEEKLEAATHPGFLTEKQKQAIWDYTGSGYEDINTALRTKDKELMNKTKEARKLLDTVFADAYVYKPLVVYRGIDLDRNIPWVDALLSKKLKERSSITEKGYLSTTASRYVAEKDFSSGILIKITTPRGAEGVSVDKLSQHGEEKEILFNRGYKLKILQIDKVDDGSGGFSYEIDAILKK